MIPSNNIENMRSLDEVLAIYNPKIAGNTGNNIVVRTCWALKECIQENISCQDCVYFKHSDEFANLVHSHKYNEKNGLELIQILAILE